MSVARQSRAATERPALVAVLGGKGGVGSTTVAVNLAAAAIAAGTRAMFLDADQRGTSSRDADWTLRLLDNLDARPELAVVDLGNAPDERALGFCLGADALLLVAAPDAAAIWHTFLVLKRLARSKNGPLPPVYLLLNMTPCKRRAKTIGQRFALASRRLLGVEVRSAGCLPLDESQPAAWKNTPQGFNVRPLSVDVIRRVLVSDALLNWRSRGKFDGPHQRLFAQQSEKEF